jgi:protein TonB
MTIQRKVLLGTFALAAAIVPITFGAAGVAAQSRAEPIPLVRIAPSYPRRALIRGDSGDVTLRFTVDVDGTTKDIEVVESTSPVFERPAVEALGKWRYALQREHGALVARHGVQTVIRFQLNRR